MTDELATGVAQLTGLLLADDTILARPQDIADIVAAMLPDSPLIGVTLVSDTTVSGGCAAATALLPEESRHVDEPGPYQTAVRTARPVSVPDLADEPRWPGYAARLLAHGLRSHDVWPLSSDDDVIGTLSVYGRERGGVDPAARDTVTLIAGHLSVLLQLAIDANRQSALTDQLRAALGSRSVIDQAVGILMGQHNCDRDSAFGILRTVSNRRNVKLAAVAADLVRSIDGATPVTAHFDEPVPARRHSGRLR
ncbi:GAF and ANTAR domain-containing protein [Nocardia wallacei]|uniref:GAF and ANTAR domain-containing protein n=1 Tax=Nocardia wallacei TaxID=480035 RepID=UPI002453AD51|nr:GAF and ANTAR domain-containing protein [Nocardia wallacei]